MPRLVFMRTADPASIDDNPGSFEVTDGGVYVKIGDIEVAAVSPDMDDPDRTSESILRAIKIVESLQHGSAAALAELHAALALEGVECPVCEGSKGSENWRREWIDCPRCEGSGRVPADHPHAA